MLFLWRQTHSQQEQSSRCSNGRAVKLVLSTTWGRNVQLTDRCVYVGWGGWGVGGGVNIDTDGKHTHGSSLLPILTEDLEHRLTSTAQHVPVLTRAHSNLPPSCSALLFITQLYKTVSIQGTPANSSRMCISTSRHLCCLHS